MAAFVVLTVFLIQKGSSEFKNPDKSNPEDELPHHDAETRVRLGPSIAGVCC